MGTIDWDDGWPWSESWVEARGKFRQSARAAGAELHALPYDSLAGFGGLWAPRTDGAPDSPGYTIDVAVLGDISRASSLVFHSSGVHGVEGYAGSAVQLAFLQSAATACPAKQHVAIVLVHGVNAHGMAEFRRWNERGVDLNRNCIVEGLGAGTVAETAEPLSFAALSRLSFPLYHKVYGLVNPARPARFLPTVEFLLKAGFAILSHGFGALKQAIAGGHYTPGEASRSAHPGLFWGGEGELEQSHRLVCAFVEKLASSRAKGHDLRRLAHIDVHTGLGPYGYDTLLVHDRDTVEGAPARIGAACAMLGGDGTREGASKVGHLEISRDAASGGTAYAMYGTFVEALTRVYRDALERRGLRIGTAAACVTQEFGTVSNLKVLAALRAEGALLRQAGAQRQPAPDAMHPLRVHVRDCFYPRDPAWRGTVVSRGLTVLDQAIAWADAAGAGD